MSYLVKKSVFGISPYLAGKPIEETKRQLGLKNVIKLASNENPLGASPKALGALKKCLGTINRYPDSQSYYLKRKLAKVYGLDPANFVLGNGSDELIDVIIKTFVEADENIVSSETTFLEYEIIAQVNARRVKKAALRYFKYDLNALARLIDKKTKLIFIANPNNPTGTYVNKDEVEEFLRKIPANVVVVFDEAYDAFIDTDDYPNTRRYLKRGNVIILKTFSKSYGLAGLRIGYAISSPQLAAYMERVRQPFNVNILAQCAALACLDDKTFLKKTRRTVLEGKAFLYRSLSQMGLAYLPSVANFILVDVGREGVEFFKAMLKFGVIIRDMKQYGLRNFIRVTIGTRKENERFVKVLKKVL